MAHNGGKSQVNFNFLFAHEYPFLNLMKSAGGWYNTISPDTMNAQGYPTTNNLNGCVMPIPLQSARPGNYVLRWDGVHGLTIASTHTAVSGSTASGSHRYVFTPDAAVGSLDVIHSGAITTPSTLIEVVHEDDEALLDAGQIFGVKFLERVNEVPFGVLRFLDWQVANTSNIVTWADRKPVDYFSWEGSEFRLSLWAGTTTNVGDAYSISVPGFALVDKAKVMLRFNANATTDTPTLNVSGTGAKVIRNAVGDSLGSTTRPATTYTATLTYDADLDCWIKVGGALGSGINMGIHNGVPIEIIVALCNAVGAHPWVHVPYLALDPPTDFATQLATYMLDNLDAGLVPRFEAANEVWNPSAGFSATRYGWNKAQARAGWGGFDFDNDNWYGRVLSLMGEAVSDVYSGDTSRYNVICGVGTFVTNEAGFANRLAGKHVSVDGGNPASDYVTHGAFTNYFGPTLSDSAELALAFAYNQAATQPEKDAIAAQLVDSLTVNAPFGVPYVKNQLTTWADRFAPYGLTIMPYEGGYSPDFTTVDLTGVITGVSQAAQAVMTITNGGTVPVAGMQVTISGVVGMTELNGNTYDVVSVVGQNVTLDVNSTAFTAYASGGTATYVSSKTMWNALRGASKNAPALKEHLKDVYSHLLWIRSTFPSCFDFAGSGNAWSVLDPDPYVSPDPPQWTAIKEFRTAVRPKRLALKFG